MSHLGNNIKIVRALCKKTQTQFASLFEGVSEAMQKSYESGKARPNILYMQKLAELSGVPIKNLTNLTLTRGSFKINTELLDVEKVENVGKGTISDAYNYESSTSALPGTVTLQDHIAEIQARRQDAEKYASKMEEEKDRLYNLLENYLNSILANSTKTQDDLKILKAQADIVIKQIARQDEAILQSQLLKSEIVKAGKVKPEK